VQTFTLTFNPNGGTVNPTSRNVQSGVALGTLPTPTNMVNHTFVGWFTTSAASGGTQITANNNIASNMTVWARWQPQNITITFNPNGGSVSPTSRTILAMGQIGTLPTLTRAGHSFVGWFDRCFKLSKEFRQLKATCLAPKPGAVKYLPLLPVF